jgi:hypothetical protein
MVYSLYESFEDDGPFDDVNEGVVIPVVAEDAGLLGAMMGLGGIGGAVVEVKSCKSEEREDSRRSETISGPDCNGVVAGGSVGDRKGSMLSKSIPRPGGNEVIAVES